MSLLRKTFTLLVGETAARILGIAVFALLARVLGLGGFGSFSFAVSVALMLGVVIDMGQNAHLGRLVASEPQVEQSVIARVFMNKLLLGSAVIVVSASILVLAGFQRIDVQLVVLMGVWATVLSCLDSLRAVARALGFMRLDSGVNGWESFGRLVAVLVVWVLHASVIWYGVAFIVEAIVAVMVFLRVLRRRTPFRLGLTAALESPRILPESWALGVSALAMAGFYRIDQVFVQRLAGSLQNGLYGAASRLAFTATVGCSLVMMAAYPELARRAKQGEDYRKSLRKTMGLCAAVALLAASVVFLGATPFVRVLYGDAYRGAVPLVRVLAIVVAANGMTILGVYSANALGREKKSVAIACVMIVANVAANLVVIPSYAALGAAWVSAGGEVIFALAMLAVSADYLLPSEVRELVAKC